MSIDSCIYQLKQDTEYFYHSRKFSSFVLSQSSSSSPALCSHLSQEVTSTSKDYFTCSWMSCKWNHIACTCLCLLLSINIAFLRFTHVSCMYQSTELGIFQFFKYIVLCSSSMVKLSDLAITHISFLYFPMHRKQNVHGGKPICLAKLLSSLCYFLFIGFMTSNFSSAEGKATWAHLLASQSVPFFRKYFIFTY